MTKINDICGGTYELCSLASKTGKCTCPKSAPVEPQAPVRTIVKPLVDVATLNTDGTTLCGWCDKVADRKIDVVAQSQADYACADHFRKYYAYLSNPQMKSALCPSVDRGCSHTMAQNEEGYGVACVEYANARGIQWMYA
jgi:hypothetical protein